MGLTRPIEYEPRSTADNEDLKLLKLSTRAYRDAPDPTGRPVRALGPASSSYYGGVRVSSAMNIKGGAL